MAVDSVARLPGRAQRHLNRATNGGAMQSKIYVYIYAYTVKVVPQDQADKIKAPSLRFRGSPRQGQEGPAEHSDRASRVASRFTVLRIKGYTRGASASGGSTLAASRVVLVEWVPS